MVTDSDGIAYPITMARLPVKVLQAGWYPVGLQTGLKPFHLLELRNDTGSERDAVWYLADDLEFICNAAASFLPEHGEQVKASLSPLLRDIHEQSLCAATPGAAPSSHAFDGINPSFTRELIGYVVDTALSPPEVVALDPLERVSAHYTAGDVHLSVPLLRHSLDMPSPRQVLEGLTLASPFDASLLYAQEQFVPEMGPGDGLIDQAYRFHDAASAATLYLLIRAGQPALYIPAVNTVFTAIDGLAGAQVLTALLSYYASHVDRFPAALPTQQADPEPQSETVETAPDAPVDDADPVFRETASGHDAPILNSPALADEDLKPHAAEAPPTNWWKRLFGLGQP